MSGLAKLTASLPALTPAVPVAAAVFGGNALRATAAVQAQAPLAPGGRPRRLYTVPNAPKTGEITWSGFDSHALPDLSDRLRAFHETLRRDSAGYRNLVDRALRHGSLVVSGGQQLPDIARLICRRTHGQAHHMQIQLDPSLCRNEAVARMALTQQIAHAAMLDDFAAFWRMVDHPEQGPRQALARLRGTPLNQALDHPRLRLADRLLSRHADDPAVPYTIGMEMLQHRALSQAMVILRDAAATNPAAHAGMLREANARSGARLGNGNDSLVHSLLEGHAQIHAKAYAEHVATRLPPIQRGARPPRADDPTRLTDLPIRTTEEARVALGSVLDVAADPGAEASLLRAALQTLARYQLRQAISVEADRIAPRRASDLGAILAESAPGLTGPEHKAIQTLRAVMRERQGDRGLAKLRQVTDALYPASRVAEETGTAS